MRTLISRLTLFVLLLSAVCITVTSCGKSGKRFRLEGRMKNLNQGELYVYAQDGSMKQADTIRIDKGRFTYETDCDHPATLIIVFPNFSELPLFTEPGGKATLKADATNMKELEIKGTDNNDAMTAYRLQVAHAAPPDAATLTETFIRDHADMPVATYLLRYHYIDTSKPDYNKAAKLIKALRAAQPHNPEVEMLSKQLQSLQSTAVGQRLPRFTLKTLSGNTLTEKDCMGSGKTVILTYAEWSNEAMSILRRLNQMLKDGRAQFNFIVINLDGDPSAVRRFAEHEQLRAHIACPEGLFEDAAVKALALTTVPDNITVAGGIIKGRSLPAEKLEELLTR